MKIKDINIVNRDPLGARTLEIRTSKIDIVTPDRGVTSTEAGYKKEIQVYYPIDDPFENKIFEAIQHFTKEQVKELHTKNGAFKRRKRNLRAVVRNHDDMLTKFFPKMIQGIVLDLHDVRALVDLQIESGLNIISIPDISINSKPRDYERHGTIEFSSDRIGYPSQNLFNHGRGYTYWLYNDNSKLHIIKLCAYGHTLPNLRELLERLRIHHKRRISENCVARLSEMRVSNESQRIQ